MNFLCVGGSRFPSLFLNSVEMGGESGGRGKDGKKESGQDAFLTSLSGGRKIEGEKQFLDTTKKRLKRGFSASRTSSKGGSPVTTTTFQKEEGKRRRRKRFSSAHSCASERGKSGAVVV